VLSARYSLIEVYATFLTVQAWDVMQGIFMSLYFLQVDVTVIIALYSWLRWQVAPVVQCSENEIYDVYIRDDDTLLRTELECRVWSAEVAYRPLSLMIYEDVQLRSVTFFCAD